MWSRLESARRGPSGRVARRDRVVAPGVVLRDDRVVLLADAPVTVTSVLDVAVAAAESDLGIDRTTLARLGTVDATTPWTPEDRATLVEMLGRLAGDLEGLSAPRRPSPAAGTP